MYLIIWSIINLRVPFEAIVHIISFIYLFFHLEFPLPRRPGFGRYGQKIPLRANFFPIKIPDSDIHHYDVTIHDGKNADKCPKSLNRKIIEEMVDQYLKVFIDRPVYDGTKNIYAKRPLNFQGVVSVFTLLHFLLKEQILQN